MSKAITQKQEVNVIVRQQVIALLREIFTDPDFGLELKPSAAQRLKKSIRSKKDGRLTPLEAILS